MYKRRKDAYLGSEIAEYLGRELRGRECEIHGVCGIDNLASNSLTFLTDIINNQFKLREQRDVHASDIAEHKDLLMICDSETADQMPCTTIESPDPRMDFVRSLNHFFVKLPPATVHHTAVIDKRASVADQVGIGSHCYLGANVKVGSQTRIQHNVVITEETIIGSNCVIKSNSTIGSEGFSFVFADSELHHFPQIGRILIGEAVWIGSNVCIERAALGETKIGDHTKIDDLVQIGHNTTIGRACQITAGAIICGKAVLEDGCWIAPNSVIDNNVRVGRGSLVGTGSVVRQDVPPGTVVAGVPAKPIRQVDP